MHFVEQVEQCWWYKIYVSVCFRQVGLEHLENIAWGIQIPKQTLQIIHRQVGVPRWAAWVHTKKSSLGLLQKQFQTGELFRRKNSLNSCFVIYVVKNLVNLCFRSGQVFKPQTALLASWVGDG